MVFLIIIVLGTLGTVYVAGGEGRGVVVWTSYNDNIVPCCIVRVAGEGSGLISTTDNKNMWSYLPYLF